MSTKNVIVIGAGGVGVITTLTLAKVGKANVHLVVRSDYKQVLENGYEIDSCDYGKLSNWKPQFVYSSITEASKSGKFFDYILVTTKNIPDGPESCTVHAMVQPLVESNYSIDSTKLTSVVLIQNGIDIEKELIARLGSSKYNVAFLSGIQLIGSSKIGPAKIKQIGRDQLTVGPFISSDKQAYTSAKHFIELYSNKDVNDVTFDMRVRYSRWKKLLYNAICATTATLVTLDTRSCYTLAPAVIDIENNYFRPAMQEIVRIAETENIILDSQLVDFFITSSRNSVHKPSMCLDKERGQLMELEVTLGNALRIAAEYQLEAPILTILYTLLSLEQAKVKKAKGLLK